MSEQPDVRVDVLGQGDALSTIVRLLELRSREPLVPWKQVAKLLQLNERELRRYRWLIAAERCAQGAGWTEAGKHPAVDFNPDYLRKHHKKVKLPGGLRWQEYVDSYREAVKRRTQELQAARGEDMAERIHELALKGLGMLEELQNLLPGYVHAPPARIYIGPKFSISGREELPQPTLFDIGDVEDGVFERELQKASVNAVVGHEEPQKRLSIEAARYALGMQNELTAGLHKVAVVLTGQPLPEPDDETEDAPDINADELKALLDQGAELDKELRQYADAGAAHE